MSKRRVYNKKTIYKFSCVSCFYFQAESVKAMKAEQEKLKGNEAFNAKSYDEAVVYYTRSIQLIENAAAYNNRALAYLKLEKWDKVIDDCNSVFKYEKDNVKGILSMLLNLFYVHMT